MDKKTIISHIYNDNGEWKIQTNEEHSKNVANLASKFAAEFGMSDYGRVIGLLHDKGKESDAFQVYIRYVSGYDTSIRLNSEHKHAYVGGIIASKHYGNAFKDLLINQIISHHSGLHDYNEVKADTEKAIPNGVDDKTAGLPTPNELCEKLRSWSLYINPQTTDFHHVSRMLYSCLVDADFLDTEQFMNRKASSIRGSHQSLNNLLPKLESYLTNLQKRSEGTEVNRIRKKVLERCAEISVVGKGFYSLTVPTGGGKTLSSLLWAMKHAVNNKMNRIIIAIPYTSIIVQTASILKNIFGEDNVLEHHSNFDPETIKDITIKEKAKLATENWDYPIIVTTNVQLFESMFSNKPSTCRKLHNIVNSVIILDEAQTLPIDFLKPIIESLKSYQRLFGVSVLFTTASQPVLTGKIEGCNPRATINGIESIIEIIPKDYHLKDKLRRVEIIKINKALSYEDIANEMKKHKQALCIVNTRKDAKEIFQRLPKEGHTIHLSRMMCPLHVRESINAIKAALNDDNQQIIRVVATQLVEAGVDIDFPIVMRQESGVDSILQAAGRCNREGRLTIGKTYVFKSKEHAPFRGYLADSVNAMESAIEATLKNEISVDWFSEQTMEEFFKQLYCRKETFDVKDILFLTGDDPTRIQFQETAKKFHLIEDNCKPVIVNWGKSLDLINNLRSEGISYAIIKALSKYAVNIREKDFNKLMQQGYIKEVGPSIYFLPEREQYDCYIGLVVDKQWTEEILIK